jgi:ribulose 1,5-bisphosphate synthetase/thiazole synthase
MIDEKTITQAIIEGYTEKLLAHLETSANAAFGSHRMRRIFGGMLLSGKKTAEIIASRCS